MTAEAIRAARESAHAEMFAAKLAEMRPRFAATLVQRLEHMEELRDSPDLHQNPADAIEMFRHYAHKTAGMASTMGFPELGELCFAAETAVTRYCDRQLSLEQALDTVDDMLGEMALIVDDNT